MEKILKRLTIKDDGHYVPQMMCSVNRYGEVDERDSCAEYCGDVISCENGRCAIQQCFDRLGEYEDLEEQGKLIKEWTPSEEPPASGKYVLLSFENFSIPLVGRYEEDENGGGTYYVGDDEKSCISQDIIVNAWMPLPELYKN